MRTARDLHDGILQSLSGTAFQLQVLREQIKRDPSAALFRLDDVEQALLEEQREVRSFIATLRSALPLEEQTLLTSRLLALCRRVECEWGLKVSMHLSPLIEMIAGGMAEQVYRVVKEALTNAATHSYANRVQVEVEIRGDRALIVVEDNGRGFSFIGRFDLDRLVELKRGPVTLKERVATLAGSLVIESSPGRARLEIELPLTLQGAPSSLYG